MTSWIVQTSFVHVLHGWTWLPQLLETMHMTFHSLLVGAVAVMAARLAGLGRRIAIDALAGVVLPICWMAFAIQVLSGGLMFIMSADQYAENEYFLAKISAVLVGAVLLAALHWSALRMKDDTGHGGARAIALIAVPIWFAALTFGRFVYTLL